MDNVNNDENRNENWSPKQDFQIPEANPKPKKKGLKKRIIVLTSGLAAAAIVTVAVFGAIGNLFSKTNSSGTGTTTTVSATVTSSSNDTESVSEDDLFTKRDLKQTYDSSKAETITLSGSGSSSSSSSVTIDGSTITITEAGIYVVSGTLSNGQIVVDCEDTDAKVQIVLDNATISNSSSACIYVKSADKVFVTTEDGSTNTLTVTGDFVQTDDNTVDGAIFSKCDLTVNGKGTLNITDEYGHGIVSKDDLRVTGSTLNIEVAKKGLQGKDSVRIDGGTINITAGTEGIEGALVYVLDGDLNIDAKDDGINASDHSASNDFGGGNGGFQKGGRGNFNKDSDSTSDGTSDSNSDGTSSTSSTITAQPLSTGSSSDSSSSTDDSSDTVGIYITGGMLNITADGDGIDSNGFLNVYDGAILDIMMPKMDGITVLKKVRAENIDVPVLLLTAKSEIDDKVGGLDAGADDYLTKPFAMKELLARVRSITRRRGEVTDSTLKCGDLSLDTLSYILSCGEKSVRLQNKEFQMLEMFMKSSGQIFSADQFMDKIWGYDSDTELNVVWVYISYIRKKLTEIGSTVKIKAVRGVGYTLETNQ